MSRAVAGYCAERIERIQEQRAQVRRLGLKELYVGLAFLRACLALGSALSASQLGPEWLRSFFTEGPVIVGWIALWHPVDMLFFARIPLIKEERILRRISASRIGTRIADPVAPA